MYLCKAHPVAPCPARTRRLTGRARVPQQITQQKVKLITIGHRFG